MSERRSDFIEVAGSGSASATPDVVVVDLRVQCDAKDVGAALSGCAERVTAVLAVAEAAGVEPADRQSTGVGVHPRYDQMGQGIIGQTGYQTLRLSVRDRDRVGDLLRDLAGAAGEGFGLDNVGLRVADAAPLLRAARDAAFTDAHSTATQLAHLAGRRLGEVVRVTEGSPGGGMPVPMARKMYAAGGDAMASMPVEAGESTVTATVLVRWAWA